MQKVRTSWSQLGHIHKERNQTNFKIVHHCHQLMKTRKIRFGRVAVKTLETISQNLSFCIDKSLSFEIQNCF